MAITVVRNAAGNCINFLGTTHPAYWNACLSAEVDSTDTDRINVINNIRSQQGGETVYEFYKISFTDFLDADGNSFNTATEAADYITSQCNAAGNTGQFILAASDAIDFSLDDTNTTILLDNGDSYAVNSIRAVGSDDGFIDIYKHIGDFAIYSGLRMGNATIDGAAVTQTLADAVNELNAVFSQAGGSTGSAPQITSNTSISLTEGDTINYELIATDGVGYEWSNLPSGVTTAEGNVRRIVGGSSLAVGTYNITAKAIYYFGEDSETITVTVSTPPFSDTKSIEFNNQDWMGANANAMDAVLGRASNGSGSGDAWSISFWIKGSSDSNNGQTFIYFGDNDATNGGNLYMRYRGGNDSLRFRYGSSNNHLNWDGGASILPADVWKHVLVTYDGGSTGASSGSLNSYYGRFKIFVDGVNVTSGGSWSHSNYGWSSGIDPDNFRVGRFVAGNYMRGCKIDELAVWSSDQSASASDIYNSGLPHDLSVLSSSPNHWWRMGDGDTYPNIQDNIGNVHFVMYNMTAADIVSDVPS